MTHEHTPGTWRITDDFIGIYDEGGRCIADMDSEASPDIGFDETLANARLISAAPDLLAALENMERILWGLACYAEESRQEPESEAIEACLAAQQLIAKAKGA